MDIYFKELNKEKDSNKHSCESRLEGDWIIWTCRECEGYERKLNWRTGEMRAKRTPTTAEHYGMNLTTGISPRLVDFLN